MYENVLDRLDRILDDYIGRTNDHLGSGGAASIEEYKQYVGRNEAYRLIKDDIRVLREEILDQ